MPKGKPEVNTIYYKAKCIGCKEEFTFRTDIPKECPFCGCTKLKNLKECE